MNDSRSGIVLVVDGGRSHLRAHALTIEGEEVASVRGSGISPAIADWPDISERLAELPEKIAKTGQVDPSRIGIAVAGLAGLDREGDQREVKALLDTKGFSFDWLLESDARQTLRAADPDNPVAIGILGTGSAFFARGCDGRIWRSGGWGPLLHDRGSGFELARQAFVAVFRAFDGTGPETTLTKRLMAMAGVDSPPGVLRTLYSETLQPGFWARFAPLVLRESERGDPVADEIVRDQIAGVVENLIALVRKSEVPEETPIHLTGGTVKGSEAYFERVKNEVRVHLPAHPCQLLDKEPYWGGWILGKRTLMGESA